MRESTTDAAKGRLHKVLKYLAIAACAWFWVSVLGMFLERRLPFLHPILTWTFRIYLGIFVAGAIGLVVVAPGVYVAKEVYEAVVAPESSKFEVFLTRLWSGCAGFLLCLLLGSAAVLICFGPLRDVKLWFIGVCWAFLMIPWWLAGYLGRKILRSFSPSGRLKRTSRP